MDEQRAMSRREAEEQRQRGVLVKVLRAAFVVLLTIVTALAIIRESTQSQLGVELVEWWWAVAVGVAAFFAVIVGVDILTPKRKLSAITAIIFGCFAGLIATALVSLIIDYFVAAHIEEPLASSREFQSVVSTVKVILGLGLCYIGITTVLQTQDDFRLVIPYVEFAKQFRGTKPLVLDTSALIDGRIMDVAEVGCFQAPLIVPRFVIDELHALSDSSDRMKRARGRRGLDLLSRMQRSPHLDVAIEDTRVPGAGVDQMIVELAQSMPAVVVTTDLGLNRVAAIHGVQILNLNDLANSLKPSVIPGEQLTLHLIKPGEQPDQAVGYLDDGTMVVVENGREAIGRTVTLTVTSAMQTSAGRLIFAKIPVGGEGADSGGVRPDEPAHAGASEAGGDDGDDSEPLGDGQPERQAPESGEPDDAMERSAGERAVSGGPIGPHRKKKLPGTPRNPRRS